MKGKNQILGLGYKIFLLDHLFESGLPGPKSVKMQILCDPLGEGETVSPNDIRGREGVIQSVA
jgi:hypothetical protein